jgi:hypothetical protein
VGTRKVRENLRLILLGYPLFIKSLMIQRMTSRIDLTVLGSRDGCSEMAHGLNTYSPKLKAVHNL